MADVSINLNDTVRVRLNDVGLAIYRKDAEALHAVLPEKARANFPLEPTLWPDGTYRTQMWHLMQMFGPHLALVCDTPFGTEIILEIPMPATFT